MACSKFHVHQDKVGRSNLRYIIPKTRSLVSLQAMCILERNDCSRPQLVRLLKIKRVLRESDMIMSKIIVKWLEWIIEIGIWLTLLSSFAAGWGYGNGFFGSLFSAIFATVFAGVFCALIFGAFIVLMDIRTTVQRIEARESNPT